MNTYEISQVFDKITSLTKAILHDIIYDQEDNPESRGNTNDACNALRMLQAAIEQLLRDA